MNEISQIIKKIKRLSESKKLMISSVDYNYFQMLNAKLKWGSRS